MFLLGHWKNFEELEEALSINELSAILDAMRDRDNRNRQFQAAMQGVDLGAQGKESVEERIAAAKRRAQARLRGVDEEDIALEEIGIGIIEE